MDRGLAVVDEPTGEVPAITPEQLAFFEGIPIKEYRMMLQNASDLEGKRPMKQNESVTLTVHGTVKEVRFKDDKGRRIRVQVIEVLEAYEVE